MKLQFLACAGALAAALAGAACGPKSIYGLSSDDNNPAQLEKALAMRSVDQRPGPVNALGKPMLFAVSGGAQRKLIAYDAEAGAPLWTIDADVQSRVAVGGELLAAREGTQLVIRNVRDGGVRAKVGLAGELLGVSTDGERVYVVTVQGGETPRPTWSLIAYGGDGGLRWRNDSPALLGAAVAQGGLVYSPFLTQWLSILDARTGAQLTRIRGIDEQISFVRATSDGAYFGSKTGAFRLDVRAASGTRAGSTYGTVQLPKQLASADYGRDAFDPVQAGYTAYDRRRILWRAGESEGNQLGWHRELVAVHFFRFVFGLTPAGELRWAYSHPRVELVASDHAGEVVIAVARDGAVVALDAASGAQRASGKIETVEPILGATFDCDGWTPPPAGEAPSTVAALATIARDRDQRFEDVKQYAVESMAKLQGADVTRDLLAIVVDPRTPPKLKETVANLLVTRKDPAGLPALIDGLSTRADFLTGAQPVGLVEVARAIAALGDVAIEPAEQARAMAAVQAQAFDPVTPPPARLELVRALIAIGHGRQRDILRAELVTYRADPGFAGEGDLVTAIVADLVAGTPEDRETVRMVAEDPRTAAAVAAIAKAAL